MTDFEIEKLCVRMRGGTVERMHTRRHLTPYSVAEHSFGVAMMVLALTNDAASVDLLKAALFHDLAEQMTGDVPATMKLADMIVNARLARAETAFDLKYGTKVELEPSELAILKLADLLDLLWFCVTEKSMGVTHFDDVVKKVDELISKVVIYAEYSVADIALSFRSVFLMYYASGQSPINSFRIEQHVATLLQS